MELMSRWFVGSSAVGEFDVEDARGVRIMMPQEPPLGCSYQAARKEQPEQRTHGSTVDERTSAEPSQIHQIDMPRCRHAPIVWATIDECYSLEIQVCSRYGSFGTELMHTREAFGKVEVSACKVEMQMEGRK